MSEGAGNRIPKTLADVSHLFFSKVEESAPPAPQSGQPAAASPDAGEGAAERPAAGRRARPAESMPPRRDRTCVVAVTGGGTAGKSTVAVNVAQALTPWGTVALFDADPRMPNARFYLGLPSWHYLSPVTGGGSPAPSRALESGLVVVDWTPAGADASALVCANGSAHVEVDGARRRLDYAVVDVPPERLDLLVPCARRVGRFVVVAAPGWEGFRSAFGAIARLSETLGAREVDLVVNRAPDERYAGAYHRKLNMAARDLALVEVRLMAGVGELPGMGSEQRERGPIVRSRPDVSPALALRNAASAIAGSQTATEREGAASASNGEER
jgi:MinD-like ATPase involved in chromosome partitioning or flagellar assembly